MQRAAFLSILVSMVTLVWTNGPVLAAAAGAVDIVRLSDWDIVVADDAIASEAYAAKEFQEVLLQASGMRLPIVHKADRPDRHVFIGPSKALRSSSVGFDVDDLGEEELQIRIGKDSLAVVGGRPRGTLYGVYEFFERYLGVRFLAYDHMHIPPEARRAKIPCESYTYSNPFSFRWSYYGENAAHPAFAAKLRVNTVTHDTKLGGVTPQHLINHSLHRQLPVSKYGKTHPEYFALVGGQRKLDVGGGGPELCVTHPDVAGIVANAVIAQLDKEPNRRNISVSQNDNDAYCRCPRCEKVNQREGTPMGSHLAFVNAVAERVEKKHPKVKIGTLAYWYTRKCPKTIKPRHNVQIQLCSIECCTLHAIDDPNCKRNQEFCRDMRNWKKVCNDIWVWNYNTNFRMYDLPFPNLRSIGPNVRFFLTNNVKGLFMQANGNGRSGEMCDLRNFVISRCLWNPELDSWALAQEFCRLHYKKAATPIIEYLTMLHDNAEKSGVHPGCFPAPGDVGLTPDICRKALKYFDQALSLADDDAVRARVEKASICAHRAMIEVGGQLKYVDGVCKLVFPPGCEQLVDRYTSLCKRHGMTMAAERMTAADCFEKIKQATAGLPAVRLENDHWRLTVLPQDNAKIVEMIHKPKDHNVLPGLKHGSVSRHTHQELGMQGYDHKKPAAFSAQQDKLSLVLTKQLPDASTIARRVWLTPTQPEKIFFQTTITHRGEAAKTYQTKAHPEFDTHTKTEDSNVLTAYVKRDRWVKFNNDWSRDHGPKEHLLKTAKGGGLAFFNHDADFGMLVTYKPEHCQEPRLWWNPDRSQANLELITPAVKLNKGQTFAYAYQFEYLTEPPK